jgi:Protein of unknown function (DUF3313)
MLSNNTVAGEKDLPEVSVEGLQLVHGTKMAVVYAKPGADLSQYNRIYLVEPQVAFRKDWLKTQNSIPNQTVTTEDMQRIKTELAALFVEVFRQELQNNGGYVLVDGAADDVLIVRPAIIDLDVFSPDIPGTAGTRSAIASVGTMTLYMELMDSVTGDLLVKAYDNKYDRTRTHIQMQNRKRNEAAARDMLGAWAELLRLALDEARTTVRPQ